MEKTLIKGLDLLEALALSDEPRGVTELADDLGMTKSNVHRLLQTLAFRGYVEQAVGNDRYTCSLKLWELGSLVSDRLELSKIARPFLQELAQESQETVHLSVLEGNEVLYIDKIDSPQPVRAYSRVGGRAPAQCVATGKSLLAYVPAAQFKVLFPTFTRYTPRSITTLSELNAELEKVREQGYAINRGEWRESVCGIASPVFDASRANCASIGISGPIERLTPRVLKALAPKVQASAKALSRALGYKG